jgi:hypothetical protein
MATSGHRVVYPLVAFDGGLNSKYAPNIIGDNESSDCKNVVFDDLGGVETRGGSTKFNTTAVGSFAGDGLFTTQFNDGTSQMVGFWGGSPYKLTGTSTFTVIASGLSVWTAGSRADMAMYQNIAFFGNGFSQPYKYNGTEWTRHGITKPTNAALTTSGTAGANGASTGDVNYKFTYVNSYSVESDITAGATTTLTLGTSASVSITCVPVAPVSFGVNARRIYRRDSATSSEYKRVATISDNTTTTYLDQIPNASLGVAAPLDQGEPPLWKFIISHQERLWMATGADSTLYYSELTTPFVVKSANFILFSDGDGEVITGLAVHANMLVVYKSNSVWLLYMASTDPAEWIRLKSKAKFGGASHYAQADFEGFRMYIGQRYGKLAGFFAIAGDDTKPNTTDLPATAVNADSMSDRIEPDVFAFRKSVVDKACAIEYKNKLWFSVPYDAALNNRVYQFDFTRRAEDKTTGSWVPFTYPYGFNAFTVYNAKLYGQGAEAAGFVYELDTTSYNDNGTAINSYIWLKEYYGHPAHQENWKDFRQANFVVETLGAYNMNVGFRTDADTGVSTKQIDLDPGGPVWLSFTWGSATWGAASSRANATIYFGISSGKRLEIMFSNQNAVNQGFHVYPNGSFTYNLRGRR